MCLVAHSFTIFWGGSARTDAKLATSGASTDAAPPVDGKAEYKWAGNTLFSCGPHLARDAVPDGHELSAQRFIPQPCATRGDGGGSGGGGDRLRPGLLCEEALVRLLTPQRNSGSGHVQRSRGVFDVLAVTRTTYGWTLDADAYVVSARDAVSGAPPNDAIPLVIYTTADGRVRSVLTGEESLLSLGRAVFADPSWAAGGHPGEIHASVQLRASFNANILRRHNWSLSPMTTNGTAAAWWLQEVAFVMCEPPVSSFVLSIGLREGVVAAPTGGQAPLTASGRRVADDLNLDAGGFDGQTELLTGWQTSPPLRPVPRPPLPPCAALGVQQWNDTRRAPVWLLGRGSRELPPAARRGAAEAALAAALGACALTTPRADLTTCSKWSAPDNALTAQLSQAYRRDLFRVDAPAEPASDTDLTLTVLVAVPEVVALALSLTVRRSGRPPCPRRAWCEAAALTAIGVAGVVSLLALGLLDAAERAGAAWRAATLRLDTRVAADPAEQAGRPGIAIDYRGRHVALVEALFVVARLGYRPRTTRTLLVGMAVGYGLLLAVAAAHEWSAWRKGTGDGGSAADGQPPMDEGRVASLVHENDE